MFSVIAVPCSVSATPITVIITTVVKKVIRAMDLAIQRLQTETIKLQNLQKALENTLSKLKLKEIYDWSQKQKELFGGYYDELYKVKSAIAYYQRVRDVVNMQVQVAQEYKRAISFFTTSKGYTPNEIKYMLDVYTGILEVSLQNIDQLYTIINSFKTQMSDAKRLEMIHHVNTDVQENLSDLRAFTNENVVMGMQRIKSKSEIETLKSLYNLSQ